MRSRCLQANYSVGALPATKWPPKIKPECISNLTPLWVYPANVAYDTCQEVLMLIQSQETVQLCNLHALLLL